MANRNIHGNWTMSFEDRLLQSKVDGAFNIEGNLAWLEEVKSLVGSSKGGNTKPWVAFVDGRGWDMSPDDATESTNEMINWMADNNCALLAILHSNRVQRYAAKQRTSGQGIIQFFFDYDEAYQASIDKLQELQN
ncbi:hypothetical protein M9194_10590 [Vibrio sp. S4M6]|uniref:hypothetical protein n=1 Tax=Vibrio sinus TaxID=2946865 RepID=UPI002029E984|nr:hypothetical protein [Vibrio sinus]MCL9781875.1 hypothetical protein [Vibrio sinus]